MLTLIVNFKDGNFNIYHNIKKFSKKDDILFYIDDIQEYELQLKKVASYKIYLYKRLIVSTTEPCEIAIPEKINEFFL